MSDRELVVVKFGSESLVNGNGIDQERINSHAERLAPLYVEHDLLVVTSGAVAWAKKRLARRGKDWPSRSRRTLAMMGSAGIAVAWENAFEAVDLDAGQVLASHYELRDDFERSNFRQSYAEARADFAIPILNHNDFMAKAHGPDDELDNIDKKKDNDEYSLEVARLLGAKVLILATDGVGGFMKGGRDGELLDRVRVFELEELKEEHLYQGARDGTGGMGAKLDVCCEAVEADIRAFICNADAEFTPILAGEPVCTEVVRG